ncbi:hypothetical protein DITRI_Ditri01bG0012000 [Diplodiscus trichospermus]
MSNTKEQTSPPGESQGDRKNETLEGLPVESSPYLKHEDLEDYKRQAYGTEGHLDVKETKSASGSTDAPTFSAKAFSDAKEIVFNDASTN